MHNQWGVFPGKNTRKSFEKPSMKKPQEVDAADAAGVPATGRGMLPMLSHSTKGSPEPGKMEVLFAATIFCCKDIF